MGKGKLKIGKIAVLLVLLAIMIAPVTFGADYPSPTSNFYVNDFANILSKETEQSIMDTSVPLAEKTGAQIVVVTIDSLGGQDIESYARGLFNEWGIGDAKKSNGLLLLIAYGDRQSRIEVGYGLEGVLNDAKTGRIQDDYLIGNFQAGDYDEGVLGTYLKLAEEVYGEYELDTQALSNRNVYYYPVDERGVNRDRIGLGEILLGIIIVIIVILDIIFNRGRLTRFVLYTAARSGGRGSRGGGGFGGGGGRSGGGGSSRSW